MGVLFNDDFCTVTVAANMVLELNVWLESLVWWFFSVLATLSARPPCSPAPLTTASPQFPNSDPVFSAKETRTALSSS